MGLKKTIVIKPTLNCNLKCKYCYEFNRQEYKELNLHNMNVNDWINMIERFAKIFNESEILWMLHGGEPLLLNKKSFENICKKIEEVNLKYGVNYKLALQTNATLIDEEWVAILKKYIDLFSERVISISIDGPEYINDTARIDLKGRGTYQNIKQKIIDIKDVGLDVTTISVIGQHNVDKIEEIYKNIKDINPNFSKFIPCYNLDKNGNVEKYGITPLQYADAICKLFDIWMKDIVNVKKIEDLQVIDPIVTIISSISNSFVAWCEYTNNKCDNFLTIYPNGDFWLCDTFQQDIHKEYAYLGNYFEFSDQDLKYVLENCNEHCKFKEFSNILEDKCFNCDIKNICNGGCIAIRDSIAKKSSELFDQYCIGKHKLIGHIKEAVDSAMSKY